MTDRTEIPAPAPDLDFGQALGTLFRRFTTSAGAAVTAPRAALAASR